MADPSTTYGPAESRRGHFPIKFSSDEPNAGKYQPPSDLDEFISKIPILRNLFNTKGSIVVNPANTNDVNAAILHEATHGLVDPMFESGKLSQLNQQNPYYNAIAQKIIGAGAAGTEDPQKMANTEAVSYARTGESSRLGVPPPLSQDYIGYLKNQLFKLDPNLARSLQ